MPGKPIEKAARVVRRPAVNPLAGVAAAVLVLAGAIPAAQQPAPRPSDAPAATFRSGVEVVTVSASVRDRQGRIVRDLSKGDFQVFESGVRRYILDVYTGDSPVSLGVVLDISGSMAVGGNMERAREAVVVAMMSLRKGIDEAALFTFDSTLQEVVPFTTDLDRVRRVSLEGRPWGQTSLFDAIAAAARPVAERPNRHRALLVITDGVDTASRMTPPEVSAIASAIDVPVYLLTTVHPLDHPRGRVGRIGVDGRAQDIATLEDLSRWTGGSMRVSSTAAHTSEAVRDLFAELRHQYLITFEPGVRGGWHSLEVRVPHHRHLTVRARGGYMAGPS